MNYNRSISSLHSVSGTTDSIAFSETLTMVSSNSASVQERKWFIALKLIDDMLGYDRDEKSFER